MNTSLTRYPIINFPPLFLTTSLCVYVCVLHKEITYFQNRSYRENESISGGIQFRQHEISKVYGTTVTTVDSVQVTAIASRIWVINDISKFTKIASFRRAISFDQVLNVLKR